MIDKILSVIKAYNQGQLGDIAMPEDTHPQFKTQEEKLLYFTLPMALNYQRDSFKLWQAAKLTWEDDATKIVFSLKNNKIDNRVEIQNNLLKYKLALQPNKHTDTCIKISTTIFDNWGSLTNLITFCESDFINLREIIQVKHKKSFPYLSGPKIFNYWSYILTRYCDVTLKNRNLIEIAPDTHVIQSSIKLGVLTPEESRTFSRDKISLRWREILKGSGIDPIDVHSPLWFWSRGGFKEVL